MSFIENLQFISHSLLSKRVRISFLIESKFMREKDSGTNNIITEKNSALPVWNDVLVEEEPPQEKA